MENNNSAATTSLKVLIVGGDSVIGKGLYSFLAQQNINVVKTTRQDKSSFWYVDLGSLSSINHLLSKIVEHKINTVILLAAITGDAKCKENKAQSQLINVQHSQLLLAKLNNLQVFSVFMSTSQVFDHQQAFIPFSAAYSPVTLYGEQKIAVEKYIFSTKLACAVVRATKVITSDFPLIQQVKNAAKNHESLTLFHDYCAAPISLDYLCEVLWQIICYQQAGIYQVSGAEDLSYVAMASEMLKLLQLDVEIKGISALEKNIPITPFGSLAPYSAASFTIALEPFDKALKQCLIIDN